MNYILSKRTENRFVKGSEYLVLYSSNRNRSTEISLKNAKLKTNNEINSLR